MSADETLCPQCGKMTRTILGGCPNCGGPKENPVYFPPRKASSSSWSDDVPLLGFALWSTPMVAFALAAWLINVQLAAGLAALLGGAAYGVSKLTG